MEELIVKAETNKTLSPIAFSESHPEDVIFYTTENYHQSAKGWILRRIDTKFNNDTQFDFRGMYFRRWKVTSSGFSSLYNGYCSLYNFNHSIGGVSIAVNNSDYIDMPAFISSETVKGNIIKAHRWDEIIPDITISNDIFAIDNDITIESGVIIGICSKNKLYAYQEVIIGDDAYENNIDVAYSVILQYMTDNRGCVIRNSNIGSNFRLNTGIYVDDVTILDNFISNTSVGYIQGIQPTSASKVYKDISVNFPYTTEIIRTINNTYRVKYYDANGDAQTEPI